MQRELKIALDKYEEKLLGDIYLIPILLDQASELPEQIRGLQYVKTWEGDPNVAIQDAVQHQLSLNGTQVQETQERSKVKWTRVTHTENWDGLPGYEIDIGIILLNSSEYLNVEDISSYVRGRLSDLAMAERETKFRQEASSFNFGQDKSFHCNTLDAQCHDPIIIGKVITIHYTIYRYGAGAAHGHYEIFTPSFLLEPVTRIRSLKDTFTDEQKALVTIQRSVRESLSRQPQSGPGEVALSPQLSWIEKGTESWDDFRHFVFREHGIEIIFPPYQVDCFAAGIKSATVEYRLIIELLHAQFVAALGINYLRFELDLARLRGQAPA